MSSEVGLIEEGNYHVTPAIIGSVLRARRLATRTRLNSGGSRKIKGRCARNIKYRANGLVQSIQQVRTAVGLHLH